MTGAAPQRVALFVERVRDYRAVVHRCAAVDLAGVVAGAVSGAATLAVPADVPDGWLAAHPGPVVRDRPEAPLALDTLDAVGVSVLTGCAAAIAETGTLLLDGGPRQGRRALTLVPDHHVCVVEAGQVADSVPAALGRLTDPRRPLTFVSGPSATSDIELRRVEGVHGPRRLEVIVVDEEAGTGAAG